MYQFRTDALSIAMIVGGATLAGGATLLLAKAGGEAEQASRCEHVTTAERLNEEQRVVVALNGGEGAVVVAPTMELRANECSSTVRVADVQVHRIEAEHKIQKELERAERLRIEIAQRVDRSDGAASEALRRAQERAQRGVERALRAQEHAVRDHERQARDHAREIRAQERQVRAQERQIRGEERRVRSQERRERVERDGRVVVWSGDEDLDFDFDFDFDFDHDFDFDFDYEFDGSNLAFEVDGEAFEIDLSGLQELSVVLDGIDGAFGIRELEGLSIELENLDEDVEREVEERVEEAMRELERELEKVRKERRGGGF